MIGTKRFWLFALAGVCFAGAGAVVGTQALMMTHASAQGARTDVNIDAYGLALKGYDPVAYHTVGRPVRGDAMITAAHGGATYRFASTANRDLFAANPDTYAPAYGGFCAYGVAQGYKVKIEPDVFRVVDGKLFLNYDRAVGRTWETDISRYRRDADGKWPVLKDKPRG